MEAKYLSRYTKSLSISEKKMTVKVNSNLSSAEIWKRSESRESWYEFEVRNTVLSDVYYGDIISGFEFELSSDPIELSFFPSGVFSDNNGSCLCTDRPAVASLHNHFHSHYQHEDQYIIIKYCWKKGLCLHIRLRCVFLFFLEMFLLFVSSLK